MRIVKHTAKSVFFHLIRRPLNYSQRRNTRAEWLEHTTASPQAWLLGLSLNLMVRATCQCHGVVVESQTGI